MRSFGPLRADLGKLEQWIESYGSWTRYALACLSVYTSTTQLISIGFAPTIAWDIPPWAVELMAFSRNHGFDGAIDITTCPRALSSSAQWPSLQ